MDWPTAVVTVTSMVTLGWVITQPGRIRLRALREQRLAEEARTRQAAYLAAAQRQVDATRVAAVTTGQVLEGLVRADHPGRVDVTVRFSEEIWRVRPENYL